MGTAEHCNALIDDALLKGAKLVCGGKAENTLMPATVLDHVTPNMLIYHEETFAPVKCVVQVKDAEEAIACANHNEYGLAAAVFGRDIARAFNVARKIESGICHVNAPTVRDEAQMPFGGVKGSGMGRFGGKDGIAEFTDLRWITVQTSPRPVLGRRSAQRNPVATIIVALQLASKRLAADSAWSISAWTGSLPQVAMAPAGKRPRR
jgi:benzaldehyde dehydrogenase (NAD)